MSGSENKKAWGAADDVQSSRHALALALRAAEYFGIAGPTTACFTALVPGKSDALLMCASTGWAGVTADLVVAVGPGNSYAQEEQSFDQRMVQAHLGMHAVSGKSWVLHLFSPHIVESLRGCGHGGVDAWWRFSRRAGERTFKHWRYGDARNVYGAGGNSSVAIEATEILMLGQFGIAVCSDSIQHAFDDLFYLERNVLADHLLRASDCEPAVLSAQLSSLLVAQFEAQRSLSSFSSSLSGTVLHAEIAMLKPTEFL